MPKYSGRSGGDENLVINLTVSGQEAAEREVKSFVNTLNTMLKGAGKYNINEYFESTKASIDSVRESLRTFVYDMDNAGNAGDFLKSYNAYIAQFDGSLQEATSYVKSAFGDEIAARFNTTFDKIVSSAERVAPSIAQVFDADKLSESFSSFTYISKKLGVDISKIFAAVNNGDASALVAEVDRLRDSLIEADYTIANLRQRVEELGDSAANQRLYAFEDTARRMAREFRSLLVTNGVGSDDIGKFQSYFRQIENGTITVRDAFAKAKQELGGLFSTPINAGGLEEALTRIESKLEQVAEKSGNARQASGGGAVAGGLLESAEQGAAAAEKETAAIEALVQQKSGINALTEALTAVAVSMQNSGEVATNAFDSINRLVESMTKLGDVDESKLSHVATIMSSLAGAAELKAGTASTDNLIRLVASINNIGDGKGIQTLKSLATIDFTRLSNLKVSGATLTHLATELPKIADVSLAPLKELANIDWSNLSALKIPKANLDNLTSLVEKTGIKVDSTGFDSMQSAINKIGTSLDGLQEKIRTTFDLSNAISQASELANQYAGVKAALDSVAAASKGAGGAGGAGGQNRQKESAELKELIGLYQQYYALESKKITAVNKGDIDNADVYRARANAIWEQIAGIEELNPKLAELAGQHERVTEAVRNWQAAVISGQNKSDSVMAKRAQEDMKALETYQKMIETYRKELESLSAGVGTSGTGGIMFTGDAASLSTYNAELVELQNRFNAIGTAAENEKAIAISAFEAQRQKVEELRKSLNQAAKDQSAASNLANKIELYASKNGAAPLAMRQQWQQWISELRNGDAVARGTVSSIEAEFKRLQNTIRTTSAGGKTFFQQMKEGWSKFGGWSLVTRSFTKVISIMKQAVTAVKEVDSAMTELRKVTDATAAGYDRFYKSATETASSVGAKLSDVINASADFARLGFSIEDASELAKVAMLYTNIGDGITDVSVATESIISTMKAFDIEASDAMSIVDKFNEVGNNFAISSAGIGEALQRSASALATAGNTIEESIGMIVAANDVVQNPESVGTAMKTLTMYLRAAKTEAEEAGISVDGMASSTAQLRNELLALTGGKLDIQIDDKNFKSSFQILKELSELWDEIGKKSGDVTQANILNLLGGKRNANVLSSIITNFQDAIDAMETASNSVGSAFAENEKYLDSIEGKTKRVEASFQTFANSVLNSGLVKAFLDIQNGILNVVSALSDAGMLLPTVVALGVAIKTIRDNAVANAAIGKISDILFDPEDMKAAKIAAQDVFNTLTAGQQKLAASKLSSIGAEASAGMREFATGTQQAAAGTSVLGASMDALKLKAAGLGTAMKALVGSVGFWITIATLAISIGSKIAESIRKAREETIQAAHDISDAYNSSVKDLNNNLKTLDGMKEEFNELNKGVDANGKNTGLAADKYDRYLQLVKQIKEISPELAKSYTDEGKALKDGYISILDEAIDKQNEFIENAERTYYEGGRTMFTGYQNELQDLKKSAQSIFPTIREYFMEDGDDSILLTIINAAKSNIDVLFDAVEKTMADTGKSLTFDWGDADWMYAFYQNREIFLDEIEKSGLIVGEDFNEMQSLFASMEPFVKKYKADTDELVRWYSVAVKYFSETSKIFADGVPTAQLADFQNGVRQVIEIDGATVEENRQAVIGFALALSDVYTRMDSLKKASSWTDVTPDIAYLKELYKGIPGIADIIDRLHSGWQNVSESERLAADNADKVIQSYENLEKVLSKISGFNTFLNNARNGKGSEDPFGMISAAKDVANAYNEIVAASEDIPKIDWTNMVSEVGENGEILWSTSGIEYYIDAVIEAAAANTEFTKNNPEVVAWLQQMAKGFDEAAASAKSLGDAMGSMESIDGLIKRINEYNGDDAEAFDIINELQKFVDEWNKIREASKLEPINITKFVTEENGNVSFANTIAALGEFRDAVINDNTAMQELKTTAPGLYAVITTMGTQAEDAAKGVLTLEDAISSLGDIASVLQEGIGGDTIADQITNAEKLAEGYNSVLRQLGDLGLTDQAADFGWREFLTIDDGVITENKARVKEYYTALVDLIVENMAKLYSLEDSEKASMKSSLLGWVTSQFDADEVKRKADEIKDAFSEIKDITSYQADLASYRAGETSYFDMLERMYDLAAQYDDIDLKDLWDFDASTFKDIGDIQLDKMIDKLATDLEINENEVEDWKNHVKKSFEEAEEAVSAYETATKSINLADSLNGFLADVRSGDKDPLAMLSSAVSLAEDLGLKLEEVVSVGAGDKMTFNTDALTTAFEKYIDDLVTAGKLNNDLAVQIKNAAKAEGELAEEAKTAAERMADALSNMQSLYSFMQSGTAGDSDILTVLKSAQEQFKAYQDMVKDGLETTPLDIFSFISIDSSGIKENVDTAKKLYADMADQMINEWIAETKRANAGKSGLTLLTGEEEWANGLTPEQAVWFNQIKTQILAHLNDLNAEVEPTVGDIINNLQSLFDFQNKINTGESVDFTSVYDDLENLKTILGDQTLNLGDIIKWQDGDFQYAFDKTDLLAQKVSEFANKIVAEMGLTGDEAVNAAEKIKAYFTAPADAFSQLNDTIGKIKSVASFDDMIGSYRSGETSFIDAFSQAVSLADELGITLDQVWDFDRMAPYATAAQTAIDAMVDKLCDGAEYSDELKQQLKDAARAAQEATSKISQFQERGKNAMDVVSSGSGIAGTGELTYEMYQKLMAVSTAYASTIEYVNGKLMINAQRFNEVTDAVAKETAETAKLQIQQNNLKIEELVKKYATLKTAEEKMATVNEIRRLQEESVAFGMLASEIDNATNAFTRFNNASDSSQGDRYASARNAFETIYNTLHNQESELFGQIGNTKYQYALDLVINPDVDFTRSYNAVERYFKDDEGLWNFADDLREKFADAAGNIDTNIADIAKELGISQDAVRSLLEQLNRYNDPENQIQIDGDGAAEAQAKTLQEQIEAIQKDAEAAQTAVDKLSESEPKPNTETAQSEAQTLAETYTNVQTSIADINAQTITVPMGATQSAATKLSGTLSTIYTTLKNISSIKSINIPFTTGGSATGTTGGGIWDSIKRMFGLSNAAGTRGKTFRGGRSLVGELGPEMVVDVENGTWETVGNQGPEFVNLPKGSIVFNHLQTENLLKKYRITHGLSNAKGTALAIGDTYAWWDVFHLFPQKTGDTKGQLPTKPKGDQKKQGQQQIDQAKQLEEELAKIKEAFEALNKEYEHYIAHQEQSYYLSERATDYTGMQDALEQEAEYYRQIYTEAMKAVDEMKAAGADDTNEDLQAIEEAAWAAYQSMMDAHDKIRALLTDALGAEVDAIQAAFQNLKGAVEEYNSTGKISIDTFQSILDGGLKYLQFLVDENGQLNINEDSVREMLKARKDQLAIETAMSYLSRIREAAENGEDNTLKALIDSTQLLTENTWELVEAQAQQLLTSGLINQDQYDQIIQNTEAAKKLADAAEDDLTIEDDKIGEIKQTYEDLNEQIEHYIKHLEQSQKVSERYADYGGIEESISAQIEEYRKIIKNCNEGITELQAEGADDTSKELQELEEKAWSAHQSIWGLWDTLYSLKTDAITSRIDAIQSSLDNFKTAIEEVSDSKSISLDTFQAIVDNGLQYLQYLNIENGQLSINEEAVRKMIQAKKEQLAVETAMSYLNQIEEALLADEAEKVKQLIGLNESLSDSTWAAVYAKLALLKTEGLSEEDAAAVESYIQKLQQLSEMVDVDIGAPVVETLEDKLQAILDAYNEIREDIEHYIAHQEQKFTEDSRAMDFGGMSAALQDEINYYNQLYAEAQTKIAELKAEGVDDTSAELQQIEESAWEAYNSMNEAFDKMNALRVDALKEELDNLSGAYSNLQSAVDEYSENGKISLNTFEQLLSGGIQYITFLEKEDGQYKINTDALRDYISARKEQLAIETALSYIANIKQALENNEAQRVSSLIDASNDLSTATWDLVFAQAAELKMLGLTDEQYATMVGNLTKLRDASADVQSDLSEGQKEEVDPIKELADAFDELNKEIEHYIAHQEQAYKVSERALDFGGMQTSLENEIEYYREIIAEAEAKIQEMKAAGADDTNEGLQSVEETMWGAYNSMYEAIDKLRSIRVDALTDQLNGMKDAALNLRDATESLNENGYITLDTFESLVDGGIQYLHLLQNENGQYSLSEESIQNYLATKKEQLAVETALNYVSEIREALSNGEVERLNSLVDATNGVSSSTWDLVYANLALAKAEGLSDAQYDIAFQNIKNLQNLANNTRFDGLDVVEEEVDPIKELADAFDELNKEIEHYIAHQEQAYKERERAWDFGGMETALKNEVGYYKQIISESQNAINEMVSAGADDTNAELKGLEETLWNASNSMYEVLDKIRSLRIDALSDEISNLSGAFNDFKNAADEYNSTGGITLDTFNSIVEGGMQYLSLLDEENGKYVIAKDRLQDYVQMRKEQLAIETAMSYVSEIREAMQNNESERINKLIDATNGLSSSTWDLVYAQAAALKSEGLSSEQYETIIGNINKLRTIAKSVNTDLTDAGEDLTSQYENQQDALDKILKYTEDLIRAEANDRVKAIQDEIEAYKEIVELKKESLQQTKQETEYQDEVADKVKEIAQLQAKADLLALDTSRAASAERQKLLQDIQDKQTELSKYQSDHAYGAQVEALDKEAEAYEKSKQDEISAIEASVSSEEKVYQLAIARIRDQWNTLYEDLINWNTEQGSVINQEITDAWEDAFAAVQKYGDYLSALAGVKNDIAGLNANGSLVVADIPKYHGGGVAGDKGRLNDEEVLAVLQKGELVVDKEQKKGLYAVVDFVKSLGERLGTKIGSLANLGMTGQMMPAFAGMAEPSSAGFVENNNITFNPSFNVNINGEVGDQASAREYGRTLAQTAADSLFDAFNRRGINIVQTLRQ